MYKQFVKRVLDIAISFCGIVLLAVPMLIIALLIKIDSKGPAIFAQTRLGRHGKEFKIFKFRTMVLDAEKDGVYSDNKDPRLTKIGKILRKTSLDELPQFFNILAGEMSFIGPRPPLTYHPWPIEEYTDEQKRMFEVRPGITGWAQINGRKGVEWNHRIELNVWYVDHVSFVLDLKILFVTVWKVLKNSDNENKGVTVVVSEKTEEAEVSAVR